MDDVGQSLRHLGVQVLDRLGVALAVRAARHGSVCVDLTGIADGDDLDSEESSVRSSVTDSESAGPMVRRQRATRITEFVQQSPIEGAPATEAEGSRMALAGICAVRRAAKGG